MKDETPLSSSSTGSSYQSPVRQRLLALREAVKKRRGPKQSTGRRLMADDSSPCDGYFLAAEEFLTLAIKAEDDASFELFADLADSFETAGDACVELRFTL